MVDETTDSLNTKQGFLVIQWVDEHLIVHEEL